MAEFASFRALEIFSVLVVKLEVFPPLLANSPRHFSESAECLNTIVTSKNDKIAPT
jgi:hypothetical protein